MTANQLKEKVAIVTGAGRGIGRAISVALADSGALVVLAARSKPQLDEVADTIKQAGGTSLVVPTDMADEDSIDHLVKSTTTRFGRLDILVNNAGTVHAGRLEQTSTEAWDRCQAVNARGPFILCRRSMPLLRKAQPGYIINIVSVVGVTGYANQIAYTASKHALRGMSIALAEELKLNGDNIRVHVVCPGGVDTDMIRNVRADLNADELISPDEIAELVLYLVTHRGNAVIDELHIRRASGSPWF